MYLQGATSAPRMTDSEKICANLFSFFFLPQGLLPIHCCAMQGRMDVMQLMLQYDPKDTIVAALNSEEDRSPPSLLHLAIANDFIDCADWSVHCSSRF